MRLFQIGIAVAVMIVVSGEIQGALIAYTNQSAWEAAAGPGIITEDFNSQTPREFSEAFNETGFNNFSLTGNKNNDTMGIRSGAEQGNINSTNFLGWGDPGSGVGPSFIFHFLNPVSALAFNWVDTDFSDSYEVTIGGITFSQPPFSASSESGFFGVVEDSGLTFASAAFTQNAAGGFVDDFGLDNIRMQSSSAVPEPSSLALLSIGGVAAIAAGIRRKRRGALPDIGGDALAGVPGARGDV